MEIITKEDFNRMKTEREVEREEQAKNIQRLTPEQTQQKILKKVNTEVAEMIALLRNPVELQKELAARTGVALESQMKMDLEENGRISETTRKLISDYNSMLDSIHKNLYGTKTMNVDLKITHSQIAAKIREHSAATGIVDASARVEGEDVEPGTVEEIPKSSE